MAPIYVAMVGFNHHSRQQAWDQSIRWFSQHGPYQPSPPLKKDPHPNRRWMVRRQWYLGQLLLLLHCLIPRSPERLMLEGRINPLVDLLRLHSGQHLEQNTETVVDDSAESSLYLEALHMAGNARVLPDMEASCWKGAWDTTAHIKDLEQQLSLAHRQRLRWRARILAARINPNYTHSEATTMETTDDEFTDGGVDAGTDDGSNWTPDDILDQGLEDDN